MEVVGKVQRVDLFEEGSVPAVQGSSRPSGSAEDRSKEGGCIPSPLSKTCAVVLIPLLENGQQNVDDYRKTNQKTKE